MELRNLLQDDDAVSPVIGVILMVAITVILAAVIGTFVLGLGDQVQSTSPSASFTFDYTNASAASPGDSITVTHDGGDPIPANRLNASVSGAKYYDSGTTSWEDAKLDGNVGGAGEGDLFDGSSEITAGTSDTLDNEDFSDTADAQVTDAAKLDLSASTIRVIWTNENEDNSATLGSWDGPEA